jgi:molybdopterin/thiamine biosynthesis adenylyltransferase
VDKFNYESAFSRNIGWLTKDEQQSLKGKTVAIAGMGGVGGAHVLTLARLGVGNFRIADFDEFEIHNMNRQAGCFISNLDKPKADTLEKILLDINSDIKVKTFPKGVTKENLPDFLEGVDIYIDGLDVFAIEIREEVFAYAYKNNIPCTTVGPMGMSGALMSFLPGKMSFEDYFGLKNEKDNLSKVIKFLFGLSPRFGHKSYLVDKSAVSLKLKKTPSTPMGVQMATAIAGTEALKILLGRGKIYCAPCSIQIDAYKYKIYKSWYPFGYKNPFFKIKLFLIKQFINQLEKNISHKEDK